jgi:lipid A ethanolaminephosphotransferase
LGRDPVLEVTQLNLFKTSKQGFAVEWLGVLVAVFWAVAANNHFYQKALGGDAWNSPGNPAFLVGLFVLLVAINTFIVLLVVGRLWAKPLFILLLMATALAVYFIQHYNVYLDADMLRNAIKSDPAEASEMLSSSMLLPILGYGVIPSLIVWFFPIKESSFGNTVRRRTLILLGAAVLGALSLFAIFQPLSSLMRNQKEARYLITPANYIYSLIRVVRGESKAINLVREPIGQDAKRATVPLVKPKLTIIFVGETARAANWGLSGYSRMTTPKLAQLGVVSFTDVTSCGTNTETSLPCMFAPVGRRDYNEEKIRRQQSLLHVLAKAGLSVKWRDNQSGCKGVCADLPTEFVRDLLPEAQRAALCETGGHCRDEGLLHGLEQALQNLQGEQVLVMHQLGSHGPAYFKRYPAEFDQFRPACQSDNLRNCTAEQIVNAYDNTLLYTDHILATLIQLLAANSSKVDSSVLYVSDHGESLGEKNLFLHGMPYAIAPDVQKKVPLFLWFSDGMSARLGLNTSCLKDKANLPIAHDHLFHTLLSLNQVQTQLYEKQYDLLAGCVKPSQP